MFDLFLWSVAVVSKETEHHQDVTNRNGSVIIHVSMTIFRDACLRFRIPNGACTAAAAVFARRSCFWKEQHSVDEVNNSVVGDDVGHDDLRVIDENASIAFNGYGYISSIERGDGLAVAEVCAEGGSAYDMVEKDFGELRQREQIFCRCPKGTRESEEGIVGGSKYGERAFAAECSCEVSSDDRCFEKVVDVAVDDDVDDCVRRSLVPKYSDGPELPVVVEL